MQRKGQFLYNTIAKEIINHPELQKGWLIPNEDSLVDEYVEHRLFNLSNEEFDKIMIDYGKQNPTEVSHE